MDFWVHKSIFLLVALLLIFAFLPILPRSSREMKLLIVNLLTWSGFEFFYEEFCFSTVL